jgi:predicted 3-demethylubiquinone-9 3-methyltransferase (glyoxalase superfamily)
MGIKWSSSRLLGEMMQEPGKAEKVMKALLQMRKLDMEILQQAYAQR